MLAIEVNFLTGRFVATAHNNREASEWPPHPARLYSALVASWAEDGQDNDEREVLEWLGELPPPKLTYSAATPRSVKTHFVPVNDARIVGASVQSGRSAKLDELEVQFNAELDSSGGDLTKKAEKIMDKMTKARDVQSQVTVPGNTNPSSAVELLPERRVKQARFFPSVTLEEPRVVYTWSADLDDTRLGVLDGLLERVTRLGHSSSLVSCRLEGKPPPATHVLGAGGLVLRCTGRNQLAILERQYERHEAVKPRSLPFSAARYREAVADPEVERALHPDTAGEWIVFEFLPGSRRAPVTRTVDVATTLRKAVFAHATEPIPEGLSGHRSDGTPTDQPHVAFLALPYTGSEFADGRIMGAAMCLPKSLDEASLEASLRAVGMWEKQQSPLRLTFGYDGVMEMVRNPGPWELVTLRPSYWAKPSHHWASATPVALPTNPGPLGRGSPAARAKAWARAEEAVVASCHHVGLPEPVHVAVSLDPFIQAARRAHDFPAFRQRGRNGESVARRLVHVSVKFAEPVRGPLMLGAGRFLGLGLMRPMREAVPSDRLPSSPTDSEVLVEGRQDDE